jgi:hypothetical protein
MATPKQIAANRANSLKSTGPRTEAGKSRSSLNALKHGCTAHTMIFPGEDATHFNNFHQSYIADFAPQGALEFSLVQELAQTQWSIARTRAHEASLFALGHENHAEEFQTGGDQTIQAAFAGAIVFKGESDSIKNIGLYLQRSNRMFLNTLKALREIQATRIAARQATLQEAVHIATLHHLLKIPFTPTGFGFLCSPEEIAPLVRRQLFLESVSPTKKYLVSPEIQVTNAA